MSSCRRDFLGSALGVVAGAIVATAETEALASPPSVPFAKSDERACFKWNGEAWGRVAFDDLKVGDRVFQVDFGETFSACAYRITREVRSTQFPDGSVVRSVLSDELYEVMPKIWGIHDPLDEAAQVKPEFFVPHTPRIESGSIDENVYRRHSIDLAMGSPTPEYNEVIELFRRGKMSPSELAAWFHSK